MWGPVTLSIPDSSLAPDLGWERTLLLRKWQLQESGRDGGVWGSPSGITAPTPARPDLLTGALTPRGAWCLLHGDLYLESVMT